MTKVYMLVGIPCSGKSSFVKKQNGIWISSDKIREELYGDESIQENPEKVFRVMWKRLCEAIEQDEEQVFYDATNVVCKRRIAFCEQLRKKYGDKIKLVACVFNTPIEECIRRAKERKERPLSEYVIWKYVKSWQTPAYWEGWDSIMLIGEDSLDPLFYKMCEKADGMDQKNKHHSLALDEHMANAVKEVEKLLQKDGHKVSIDVLQASRFHDIGKPLVQTFDEEGFAHYYAHENVSGYLTLGFGILTSSLVSHHMDIFKKTKLLNKMDVPFRHYLELMYQADLSAH